MSAGVIDRWNPTTKRGAIKPDEAAMGGHYNFSRGLTHGCLRKDIDNDQDVLWKAVEFEPRPNSNWVTCVRYPNDPPCA